MTTLREEIANIFDECMGYWEGIKVPDHEEGHRAIDYSDKVLQLVEKRIEEKIHVMRGTKYNNGMSTVFYKIDALEEFKKELLTE